MFMVQDKFKWQRNWYTKRFYHPDKIIFNDTVNVCYISWKKNLSRHYSISNKKSYSIQEVAKMFKSK